MDFFPGGYFTVSKGPRPLAPTLCDYVHESPVHKVLTCGPFNLRDEIPGISRQTALTNGVLGVTPAAFF